LTTVCGTGGDIRFCGQKQTLILYIYSTTVFYQTIVEFVLMLSMVL